MNEKNYFSSPVLLRIPKLVYEYRINVVRFYDIEEIFKLYPEAKKKFKERHNKDLLPYGAVISTTIDLPSIGSIYTLQKTPGFEWMIMSRDEIDANNQKVNDNVM